MAVNFWFSLSIFPDSFLHTLNIIDWNNHSMSITKTIVTTNMTIEIKLMVANDIPADDTEEK